MGRRARREPAEPPDAAAALEIAARFLGTRPRARREVELRLQRAGVDGEVIAATLRNLERLGYLDDAAFARWWAEQRDRHAPRGRRMVEAELRRRGVPPDVLESVREAITAPERQVEDEALPASEEQRARVALDRHLRRRPVPVDPRARQRLGAFLVRRGFDPETARSVIRAAAEQDGEPQT